MVKYCLPIIKETKEEVLRMIRENANYDFYEIWLSYIKDLDTDFVWNLSEEFDGKLIFLFRKQKLEKSNLEKEEKEKTIKLIENSENFLDLDINDQKEELEFVGTNGLKNKLIVSYHNYKETPSLEELLKIVQKMDSGSQTVRSDSWVFKIATFCKNREDSLKLMALLLKLKEKGLKYILSGMGTDGIIVRVFGAIFGNEINFAPKSLDEKSAEGQLVKADLEKAINLVEGK